MTSDEFIKLVVEKITSFIPDEFPQPVKDVYQTAIDFYGEEYVDLQKNTSIELWEGRLNFTSISQFLNSIGIYNEYELFLSEILNSSWNTLYDNTENINLVLDNITKEGVLSNFSKFFYSIIIHFHNITISNEHGNSTIIEDMYANVPISPYGCIHYCIYWMRTTFSYNHYRAKYIHSHIPMGQKAKWNTPCLGNGPIKLTINSLDDKCDLSLWSLFWLELDKCIRTESITGGPYICISDISYNRQVINVYRNFLDARIDTRIESSLLPIKNCLLLKLIQSNKLKYSFITNHIEIVTPYVDFTVLCSNLMFEILKELPQLEATALLDDFISLRYINRCQIKSDGSIYFYGRSTLNISTQDRVLDFEFKGQKLVQKIIKKEEENKTPFFTLLSREVVTYIYNQLTIIINNLYANKADSSKKR